MAAKDPGTKTSLLERLRFTKHEKTRRVAMKKIHDCNSTLSTLVVSHMLLNNQGNQNAEKHSATTMPLPLAKSEKFFESLYKVLASGWPKGCCNQFRHEARLTLSRRCDSQPKESDEGINLIVSLPGESENQPNWQWMTMFASQEK